LIINIEGTGTLRNGDTQTFGLHNIEISPLKMNALLEWAGDSVGSYRNYLEEKEIYVRLPKIIRKSKGKEDPVAENVIQYIRPCMGILEPMRGNRSCFDKCK
jgi:hypothetical protein